MSLSQLAPIIEDLGWIVDSQGEQLMCGLEIVEIEGTPYSVIQGHTFSVRFDDGTWLVRLFDAHPEPQPMVNEFTDMDGVLELIRTYHTIRDAD